MGYERVQTSPLWLFVSIPVFIGVAVAGAASEAMTSVLLIATGAGLAIIAIVAHFSRMKVAVADSTIRVSFGSGWPRRVVELERVTAVEIVRNHWYWGWGIRGIPHGWSWNVWGLDAVELQLSNGKRLRIGTDDPQGLYAALLGRWGR